MPRKVTKQLEGLLVYRHQPRNTRTNDSALQHVTWTRVLSQAITCHDLWQVVWLTLDKPKEKTQSVHINVNFNCIKPLRTASLQHVRNHCWRHWKPLNLIEPFRDFGRGSHGVIGMGYCFIHLKFRHFPIYRHVQY